MKQEKVWLQHYPKGIPKSLHYEEKSLHSYLEEAAAKHPFKTALHFMGKNMTYQTVYEKARRLAYRLQQLGVKKGDRVAVMLANTPQSVICYYGVLMAGAVVVQTNPLYVEKEIQHQLKDSQAKVMICLDLLFPRVEKVRAQTDVEHVIVTSIKDYLPFPKNFIYPLTQKRKNNLRVHIVYNEITHPLKEILSTKAGKLKDYHIRPKEDLALLQYTGGTTGRAKGVMLTHYNLVANTKQCLTWMEKTKKGKEVLLAALPFFHVYGMTTVMNVSVMHDAKMIILPKFDPLQVLKAIQKHRVTLFPGAPTMYVGLAHQPKLKKYDLSSIKACLSGSAPLPLEVQEQFEQLTKGKIVEGYGLTEASPVVICSPIWGKRKPKSIGLPWPDTDAAILSQETGNIAEAGEIGEIIVKGPQVMKGYWSREQDTKAAFKDGWLLTGDMGYMDEDGYFYIVDRKKDMIIAGGFNIYPREVEEVLYEHPAVQETAVIGVADPYRGETVKAFIVLKEHQHVTKEELEEHCRKYLAAYKVPHQFEYRKELPKTIIGKVLKRTLSEEENAAEEKTNKTM
ncbi:long-chain acyl-CoA synthetase [Alteribacillus persepolensis]|uniref:Long-chain acyl-CoA synthetase n=1 Tax=Alteribacillus persepolensis TaxID=568899 RepID=A0A1G8BN06_9BACI|nr:long-chain-fatty-acid--CoA ligase [Alteribacillus persepolensis]SDH34493.1 long-chain acyl-CoA synthetase [Alteribacillus persepolensis]